MSMDRNAYTCATVLVTVAAAFFASAHDIIPTPQEYRETGEAFRLNAAEITAAAATCRTDATLPGEGYRLTVGANGILIESADAAGAFYAVETLKQLAKRNGEGWEIPGVVIKDWPKMAHRGVMLDVSRHFFGIDCIKRQLDWMAAHKFNVFHWHFNDDQGWRNEVAAAPELVAKGAWRHYYPGLDIVVGGQEQDPDLTVRRSQNISEQAVDRSRTYGPYSYSLAEQREIVDYAAARHIKVIPELEMPAHCGAMLRAHPEFTCTGHEWEAVGEHRYEVLCAGNDDAIRFCERRLDELMDVFPSDIIHIGGDEVNPKRWNECPKCQARMRAVGAKDAKELQGWFTTHFVKYAARRGRRLTGWSAIGNGNPDRRVIIQSGSGETGYFGLFNGYEVVWSANAFTYWDWSQSLPGDHREYMNWKPFSVPFETVWGWNPFRGIPEEFHDKVRGVEACLWSEHIRSDADLEWKLWPRALALIDMAWGHGGNRISGRYADFYRRAAQRVTALRERGVNAADIRRPLKMRPDEGLLILHLDFNSVQLKVETVKEVLTRAAQFGYNAVLWEIENKVRWQRHPEIVDAEAFTPAEFRELLAYARQLGLKPIPLLQILGHGEYVLMHGGHGDWMEDPAFPACYCVAKPEVREFMKDMIHEYLELFGDEVTDFHLGCDEAKVFATCAQCRQRGDKLAVFLDYYREVAAELKARGIRPGIWCDLLFDHREEPRVRELAPELTVWFWDYKSDGYGHVRPLSRWQGQFEVFERLGFDLILATSSESYRDGQCLPRYREHGANVIWGSKHTKTRGYRGHCLTSWSVHCAPKRLQYPLWEAAAKVWRDPTIDGRQALDAASVREFGVPLSTLEILTAWDWALCDFQGESWAGLVKPAQPAPKGQLAKVIERLEAKFGGRWRRDLGTVVAWHQRLIKGALRELEGAPKSKVAELKTGAELQLAYLEALAAFLNGERLPELPVARMTDFYALEQAPKSAALSAEIAWSILAQIAE